MDVLEADLAEEFTGTITEGEDRQQSGAEQEAEDEAKPPRMSLLPLALITEQHNVSRPFTRAKSMALNALLRAGKPGSNISRSERTSVVV